MSSLRKLITFTDAISDEKQVSCSRVSVKGGATYCILGPVCGTVADGSSTPAWGTCPSKGTASIANCLQSSPSYAAGCVAPVDAHCVLSSASHWECIFPPTHNDSSSTTSTAAPLSASSSNHQVALSASTPKSAPSESELEKLVQSPSAALNVIVGATCCVIAVAGLVLAKKRHNKVRRSNSGLSASANSSILTL
ncbi:hypothetical protein PF005_g16543 [Phytophthora fragariae]|uniref:Uncharacterized protein n=1 Tax=Phytophthora fragariae TaxID=53985 RepID=A0A6A3TCT5_9STRA|nr:hypothetical protein PF003_g33811 [Phytophthora fragariae]KAE8932786.1 hypothetical protein PF009_g17194 [Phytophthora fragariae]KAE9029311.1 hypothetical protein PF011_g1172 [Phytophthora fragariae]KAE9097337.1 hypothetical protein PF007_g16661 [Phytophthora fragariae]KAE9131623.1 hypothetical protein PF006_g15464 [Phytophthora fragariae]